MGAFGSYAAPERFDRKGDRRGDLPGRFKDNELRNGAGGGRTAERAVIEMGMGSRVMVVMRRHLHGRRVRTQFQQKGRAARRHEADRDVGSKQEYRQQDAGVQIPPLEV